MTRRIFPHLLVFLLVCGLATAADSTLVDRAQKGDAVAQFVLGLLYFRGEGVMKDSAEAAKWWRKSADQGNARAEFNLGNLYAIGDGAPKDVIEAIKWWRKAGDRGLADAQCNLGLMYLLGEGVPKDMSEAAKWYRRAAEQGIAAAQFNLGLMYGDGRGVLKDNAEALKWFSKAAEQGDAAAQNALGVMYENGDGVSQESTEAVKWYRKAADQGMASAQSALAWKYANGSGGLAKDSAEAVKWWRKAAEQGNASAQGNLGIMYANGTGVPKDSIEGLAWINIGAASGDERSIKNRDVLELRVGAEVTLAAQQRSKQIVKEMEAAKRIAASSSAKDSAASLSPVVEIPQATGSGTIVSTEGYVLTAAHVVVGASSVKVVTAQGIKTASVLRVDEANDLAVLKLSAGTYSALPVAPSRRIRLGQTVATIGFPNIQIQGFSPKVTRGEISSLNGFGDDPRSWQISVPVQTGNSGGPLLDENGNVIGVVVSKLGLKAAQATGDLPQNVNYAVKSTYALALLEPYLESSAPEPNPSAAKPRFEDMVAKAQQSVVLILVY